MSTSEEKDWGLLLYRNNAISSRDHQDVSTRDHLRALSLHSLLDCVQVPEIPQPEAPVSLLLRQWPPRRVEQQRRVTRLAKWVSQSVHSLTDTTASIISYIKIYVPRRRSRGRCSWARRRQCSCAACRAASLAPWWCPQLEGMSPCRSSSWGQGHSSHHLHTMPLMTRRGYQREGEGL